MTSKIEWLRNADGKPGYSINPIKGLCPMDCKDNQGKSYCYARRMYKRFKWNPEIRYDDWCWQVGPHIPKGSKIFVGSTMELFGPWVKDEWLQTIFDYCDSCHSRTFIFLTKCPQNLARWSPFPDNCWVGTSVTRDGIGQASAGAITCLEDVEAKVKFVSFEPLLEYVNFQPYVPFVDWLIIGQQTPVKASTRPKIEWLTEIVTAAQQANIPVFLKANLKSLFPLGSIGYDQDIFWDITTNPRQRRLRQEFPER